MSLPVWQLLLAVASAAGAAAGAYGAVKARLAIVERNVERAHERIDELILRN